MLYTKPLTITLILILLLYTLLSTLTRGHQLKLFKHHSRRSKYFFNRIINDYLQPLKTVALLIVLNHY